MNEQKINLEETIDERRCLDCPYSEPVFHCKKKWTEEDYQRIEEEQERQREELINANKLPRGRNLLLREDD